MEGSVHLSKTETGKPGTNTMLFIVFPRNAIRSPSPQRKFSKLLQHFCLARRLLYNETEDFPGWSWYLYLTQVPQEKVLSQIYTHEDFVQIPHILLILLPNYIFFLSLF